MGGHGEPWLEGAVAMDGATDITAEGGIGAASRSTLGLTGSSMDEIIFNVRPEMQYNSPCFCSLVHCLFIYCLEKNRTMALRFSCTETILLAVIYGKGRIQKTSLFVRQ